MNLLPKARQTNIVVQELGKELLIYDLTTHRAFQLNETSKTIFEACDNQTSFNDLKRRHKFTDDLIYLALAELKANDLLPGYESDHFKGLSRREAIRKVGLASMLVLPVVIGLTAPQAVEAASGNCQQIGQSCTVTANMPIGNCCVGRAYCSFGECEACAQADTVVACTTSANDDCSGQAYRCCSLSAASKPYTTQSCPGGYACFCS